MFHHHGLFWGFRVKSAPRVAHACCVELCDGMENVLTLCNQRTDVTCCIAAPLKGGGGNISVFNVSAGQWLPRTWEITPRRFLSCAAAAAAGGAKGYVVCGGGENGCGAQVDVFKVSGDGGVGHAIELVRGQDGASLGDSNPGLRRRRRSEDSYDSSGAQPQPQPLLNGFGNLSQGRKKASAAGQGDVLMIAGGYSGDDDGSPPASSAGAGAGAGHGGGYSSRWDMFNATTGNWSSGTWPSAVGRQYGVGIGCGGMLLFVRHAVLLNGGPRPHTPPCDERLLCFTLKQTLPTVTMI